MKAELIPADISLIRSRLRVIAVKDMMRYWIILTHVAVQQALEEDRNRLDGCNYYPWPRNCEYSLIRLAEVRFNGGYSYPKDREEIDKALEAEAERFRIALGIELEITYAESI